MGTRKWTRERVIGCIQEWHQRGTPASHIWRADPNLCAAGVALFGTWRAALEAAGLASDRQRWSPERVLAELRTEHSGGLPSGSDKSRLNAAAIRYFGSRRKALIAAGLPPRQPPRVLRSWTPEQVIEAMQSRRERGLPLTCVWRDDKALYATAKRLFGSWRNALRAAGFEHRAALSREEVIAAIQMRHRRGLSMIAVWRADPSLFNAAKRCFGRWHAALAAAGLPSKPRPQRWSKRTVVETIRRRDHDGPPLSQVWRDDKSLFRAATRKFGNWQSALRAAGVTFKPLQRWSRERVLEALRHTYRIEPNFRTLDPALAGAAFRFYGGLNQALEAAGLPPPPGRWTKRRIIEEIQERYVRGGSLQFVGFKDKPLGYAAKRHFGSWHAAIGAAGLESRAPTPVVTRTWTSDAVLEAIRAQRTTATSVAPIWKDDTGLYSVAKKHFGSWRNAVIAAGLQPAHRRWTKELVIQEINARKARGLSLSSGNPDRDVRLIAAALRYFGGWGAAKTAAEFEEIDKSPTQARNQEKRATACREKT